MLKITRLKSASRSGDYYGKDDYYVTGEANKPGLEWGGEGAKLLGLDGKADPADFKKLLQGQNPDGAGPALSKRDEAIRASDQAKTYADAAKDLPKHAPGWDMTFSAPKSFSIMALVAGDERLQDLHNRAVQRAMDYAEKHFSVTRNRTEEAGIRETITGTLVYATTEHGMSRAGDPAMHNHVVVMNTTRCEDGKWQALETRYLYKNMQLLGQIYQAELQHGARALGYNVVAGKTPGTWEIAEFTSGRSAKPLDSSAGPAQELIEAYSRRHAIIEANIEAATAEKGRPLTAAERQAVILKDRPDKLLTPREQVREGWRELATSIGVDLDRLRGAAVERETGQDLSRSRFGEFGLVGRVLGYLDEKVFGNIRDTSPQASLAFGLRAQEAQSTIFTQHAIISDAMRFNGNLHRIDDYLQTGFFQRAELVKANRSRLEHITTQRAIDLENALVEQVSRSKVSAESFTPADVDRAICQVVAQGKAFAPNADQTKAVNHVLTDGRLFTMMHGSAGVGKTTTFNLLQQSLDTLSEGRREMFALAPTHKARGEIPSNIPSETAQLFLLRNTAQTGQIVLGPSAQALRGKYLLLDEASMFSNHDLKRIIDLAEAAGVAKVILSFDERQLASMEAGAPARLAMHQGASTVTMTDNIRQKEMPVLRDAVMKLAAGKTYDALPSLRPYIIETKSSSDFDLAAAAVEKWRELGPETKVVVATNKMRAMVSGMIRNELQKDGRVGTEDILHTIYTSEGKSKAELAIIGSYAVGQHVIFHQADPTNRIGKHTVHEVVGVDHFRNRLELWSESYGNRSVSLKDLTEGTKSPRFGIFRQDQIRLSVGDQLAWNITDKKRGITNNNEFTVARIQGDRITILQDIEQEGGKVRQEQVISLKDDHVAHFMSHAYAITANRAQGQSFGKAIAVLGSQMGEFINHARAYVMTSRPKYDFQFVTDDIKALFRRLAENDGINPSALDHIGDAVARSLDIKQTEKEPSPDKQKVTKEGEPKIGSEEEKQPKHGAAGTSEDANKEKQIGEKQITVREIGFSL
ncbi:MULTISPECIES: MobF family relaxase [Asticcacaulis]|jgi:conjugative relaxase-like TrwC/TraI family protein|uniref:MobF family relaxase n=1 Tax=Asticcacaulis TaxID=76890 RepID=UPI001AEB328A|nr:MULTISPECIES: MobF family relaxase [Asticcacaulis]MBP2160520.1 conjugative relaxase-like TrwC/TraI family protein [Asticcacaulis solisilvae]MDR6801565.1 conjugative relaxase-like TrwC/TraI family protein [Asticcacaulis sp. BE141]